MSIATSSPCARSGNRGLTDFGESNSVGRDSVEPPPPATLQGTARQSLALPADARSLCSRIFRNAGAKLFACRCESPASVSFSPLAPPGFPRRSRGKPARAAARSSDRSVANHPAATAAPVRNAANTSPGVRRIFIRKRTRCCSIRGRSGSRKAWAFPRRRPARAARFVTRPRNRSRRAG